jgi:selenide,water dikinase
MAGEGFNPGGAGDNRSYLQDKIRIDNEVEKNLQQVLFDPQTSGGLLIAIPPARAAEFSKALQAAGLWDKIIGEVIARCDQAILVHTAP